MLMSNQLYHREAETNGIRPCWFVVEPNRNELIQIGALIDAGHLRPIIDTVFPLLKRARHTSKEPEGTREARLSCVWWTKRKRAICPLITEGLPDNAYYEHPHR